MMNELKYIDLSKSFVKFYTAGRKDTGEFLMYHGRLLGLEETDTGGYKARIVASKWSQIKAWLFPNFIPYYVIPSKKDEVLFPSLFNPHVESIAYHSNTRDSFPVCYMGSTDGTPTLDIHNVYRRIDELSLENALLQIALSDSNRKLKEFIKRPQEIEMELTKSLSAKMKSLGLIKERKQKIGKKDESDDTEYEEEIDEDFEKGSGLLARIQQLRG